MHRCADDDPKGASSDDDGDGGNGMMYKVEKDSGDSSSDIDLE